MEHETLQRQQVEVRVLKTFGIGDRLPEIGETIAVSASRASYLCFLGLAEKRMSDQLK
jgi:hypothetical protein